jgi:hypothetical protein
VANLFDKDFLLALALPGPEGLGHEGEDGSSSNGRAETALVRVGA